MEWTYNMIISLLYFNSLNIIESVLVNLVHPNITSITSIGSSPCSGQRNIVPLTAKHSSGSCGKKRPLWSYPKTSKGWNHEAPNSTVTRWGDLTLSVLWENIVVNLGHLYIAAYQQKGELSGASHNNHSAKGSRNETHHSTKEAQSANQIFELLASSKCKQFRN